MSSNFLLDRYRTGQQLDISFPFPLPVTVPEVFVKNNSAHLYSVDLNGSALKLLPKRKVKMAEIGQVGFFLFSS